MCRAIVGAVRIVTYSLHAEGEIAVTRSLSAALALAFVLGSACAPALAATFAPHRAVYAMVLGKSRPGSGVAAVSGEMAVQWTRDCQGWTFEHHSLLDIAFAESEPVRLSTHASSWESDDSTQYSFTMRHAADGRETERVEGRATVAKAGDGFVDFIAPEKQRMELPGGTLFPVAHSEAVLDAAERARGATTLSRPVFDGMGDDGPFDVNAVVSPGKANSSSNPAAAPLSKLASYRLSLAYFPVDSVEAEPKHEMEMLLYANGVADDLMIDFDDFTVRAVLQKVEMLHAPPSCPD